MTTIVVTTEHIANGEPENSERCPIALAIRDALPDAGPVAVDGDQVAFTDCGDWFEVELPARSASSSGTLTPMGAASRSRSTWTTRR